MEVIACDDASMRAEDLARIAQAPASVPPERKDGGAGGFGVRDWGAHCPGGHNCTREEGWRGMLVFIAPEGVARLEEVCEV
eukprot:scaffold4843_cov18-Tisochrysis_lutea.AAC.3